MLKQIHVLFILSFMTVCFCQLETVTVNVAQGNLRGKMATGVTGLKYYSFQGIPYAKPPVGSLRFKAPQVPDSWEGVRDALTQGSVCPQNGATDNEDCLFLNVFTTQLQETSTVLKPVLVWIHGGYLAAGSGNIESQGPDFLLEGDIVVVTINYRLGALGFISLQGTEITSNNGARDQNMALQWVQQNIAIFGGDPNKVTIWGESAGARSVHYQMLSPMSKGLFHQVIAESGSALSPHAIYAPGAARTLAFNLGEGLGIITNDTTVLIEGLKKATPKELVDYTTSSGMQFTVDIEYEVPAGEEAFMPGPPMQLVKEGKYQDVPLLIGTNANEGLLNIGSVYQNPEYLEYLNEHFEVKLPWHFNNSLEIAAKVKKFYFGDKDVSQETLLKYVYIDTDFTYLFPTDRQIKLQAGLTTTPIYYYKFTFDGRLGLNKRSSGDYIPGVSHAEELGYIFYSSVNDPSLAPDSPEVTTRSRVVKMWTNFVNTGNPTPSADPLLQNITWNQFTQLDHFYLEIGKDLSLHRDVENDRIGFMADIYSNIDVPM